jgi:hypothetical protein
MTAILSWALSAALLLLAYPLADGLLRRSPLEHTRILTAALALALGCGLLTLGLYGQMLLGIRPTLITAVLPYLVITLPFALRWRKTPAAAPAASWPTAQRLLTFAMLLLAAGILFNAAYWPFHGDDVMGIYGRYGKLIADTRALVPFVGRDDAFYQAYPIHISLTYAFAFIASGWENEYLARVFPALLSLGTLLAAYELGRHLYRERVGWLAALLLALTPTFARWASSGYVDLPMAFTFSLAALFAWRWRQGSGVVDAFLTGFMLGLAAWTKNAALMGAVFLGAWVLFNTIRRRMPLAHLLWMGTAFAVIVVAWYGRNWVEAGLIIPPTAWTEQAQHTLAALLVFVLHFENYSISGLIVTIGTAAALWRLLRQPAQSPADGLLLTLTVPFFGAWWWLVSYDPRFLLLFYPLLCVLGGAWLDQISQRLPSRAGLSWALTAATLLLLGYNLWISIEYKPAIVRDPLMSDAAKHAILTTNNGAQSNQR